MTLLEVLIAGVILVVALPPLIDAAMAVVRVDAGREERAHATDLQQLTFERIHHRLYNEDDRGYHLNDAEPQRRTSYDRGSWRAFFDGLPQRSAPVFQKGAPQGGGVAPLFAPGGGQGAYLTEATHPELVRELADFELEVVVVHHLDDAAHPDPALLAKRPDDPKLDLARVTTTVRWRDARGRARTQTLDTRYTRPLFEPDALGARTAR